MITYKDSGVDKEEGYKSIEKIKDKVAKTHSKNVLNNLGSFAALYELGKYNNPVLVSGTDGVGTKLKVAFEMRKYDTVGIDCVAMCVNDILCQGAKPLFFLDYLVSNIQVILQHYSHYLLMHLPTLKMYLKIRYDIYIFRLNKNHRIYYFL